MFNVTDAIDIFTKLDRTSSI